MTWFRPPVAFAAAPAARGRTGRARQRAHVRTDPVMTNGAPSDLGDRADLTVQASTHDAMESPAGCGRLRIYLGIAPGVGKTYAMLRDGRARRRSGVNAVVAYRERHGRAATAAQLGDLEELPTRTVTYRGTSFEELDVSAVLERGRNWPWWTNSPTRTSLVSGTRNAGRTSASCSPTASTSIRPSTSPTSNRSASWSPRITGVHQAEPVPDAFLRASEIKLVDLAPAALRHRLAQGLVVPARAGRCGTVELLPLRESRRPAGTRAALAR